MVIFEEFSSGNRKENQRKDTGKPIIFDQLEKFLLSFSVLADLIRKRKRF